MPATRFDSGVPRLPLACWVHPPTSCGSAEGRSKRETVSALSTDKTVTWEELVHTAYFQRIQLSAAGFYRTEGLHWDLALMKGEPFKYFVYGVAASEVEISAFDGSYVLRRVD